MNNPTVSCQRAVDVVRTQAVMLCLPARRAWDRMRLEQDDAPGAEAKVVLESLVDFHKLRFQHHRVLGAQTHLGHHDHMLAFWSAAVHSYRRRNADAGNPVDDFLDLLRGDSPSRNLEDVL